MRLRVLDGCAGVVLATGAALVASLVTFVLQVVLLTRDNAPAASSCGWAQPRVVLEPTCPAPPTACPADDGGCPAVCPATDDGGVQARDLGVPFVGTPGPFNAITDVPGVLVGHATQICGTGLLSSIRTGVTAILPRGIGGAPVAAGFYSLSGNGEFTGMHWVQEAGCMPGPIMTTNTNSVGSVHQAVVRHSIPLQSVRVRLRQWG
jgi:hypothetical protein